MQLSLLNPQLDEKFKLFHADNPHVYVKLVELARELKTRGHNKIGIGMLFEVMRWQWMRETYGDHFKLNNNYRSRYARMIEEREPDLTGIFELRELKS